MLVASGVDLLNALSHYLWPVIVLALVLAFYPAVRRLIETRNFTVKVGSAELSVQDATEQIQKQLADLQLRIAELSASDLVRLEVVEEPLEGLDETIRSEVLTSAETPTRGAESARAQRDRPAPGGGVEGTPAAPTNPFGHVRRILWVDDHPENNAFLVATLRDQGVDVTEVTSTAEALSALKAASFDVVVTDLSRREGLTERHDAGVALISQVRDAGSQIPVIVYASELAIRASGATALAAGAVTATASPTTVLEALQAVGNPERR
jgi:CheY-like chemotaxis protein